MKYCPYCAEELTKPAKVCPNCKKLLDVDVVKEAYLSGEGSGVNRKILRQKWFKEHTHIIMPIVTLIIGLVVGGLFSYAYANWGFSNERSEYKSQISGLKMTIASKDSALSNSSEGFQEQLGSKNNIIKILTEQRKLLIQIINFTRRLANNAAVTPNSASEADYYRRNVRYLIRQFENEQTNLAETNHQLDAPGNLVTIPQIIEE